MSNITMNDTDRVASVGVSSTTAYLKLQDVDAMSADNNSVTINKQLELSTDGTLGANLISTLRTLIRQTMYPVGSLYISMHSTKPETVLGFGKWVQIVDTFLYCANSSGVTGGEATHTLTIEEMPSHTHTIQQKGYWSVQHEDGGSTCKSFEEIEDDSWSDSALRSLAAGGLPGGATSPHNNMPPYMTVYCWQRTE